MTKLEQIKQSLRTREQLEESLRSMSVAELKTLTGIDTDFDAKELPREAYRYFPNLTDVMLEIPPSKRECPALMELTAMQMLAEIELRERNRSAVDVSAVRTPRLGQVAHGA